MSDLTILAQTVSRLFSEQVTSSLLESAEKGQWPAKLWQLVEDQGLTLPQIAEARGGTGGTWQDAHVILNAAGHYAVPLPLAETMAGAWLLAEAGLDVPAGPLTVAPVHPGDRLELTESAGGWRLRGTATRVPWGRAAEHVVVFTDGMVALVADRPAGGEPGFNLAREPRDTLTWSDSPVVAAALAPDLPADALFSFGALARSAQMAGGLEYLLAQTLNYVSEREQFGRPLSAFQVIRHELAVLAGHAAAATMAAAAAFRAADQKAPLFEIAVAKLRTGEAAGLAAAVAHQCHGAIGLTYEHSLHFVTRRLWSWRNEFGSERAWAVRLGREVADSAAGDLWSYLTAR